MGYLVVDMLVERVTTLATGPVLRTATREEMEARLAEPAPEAGNDFASLLARLDSDVLPYVGHFDHPRFFGPATSQASCPSAAGQALKSEPSPRTSPT